jgi:hypothetical protein
MNDEYTAEEHEWRQKLRLLVEEVLPEFQACLASAIVEENGKFEDKKCDDCLQQHIKDAKAELLEDLQEKYTLTGYDLFMLGYLERTEEATEETSGELEGEKDAEDE